MKPSIRAARKELIRREKYSHFSPYSMAWLVTNEDLRPTMRYARGAKNALTVAASGDHPMFTKIYGAEHIDTFDISYNAKLIMDIKITALSLLGHTKYCDLLKLLHWNIYKPISLNPDLSKIIEKLSKTEQNYIEKMGKYQLWGRDYFFESGSLPTKSEYEKMRKNIDKTFNFIWSDITELHTELTKEYDFIHLSNIFDYMETYNSCTDVLGALIPYMNPGCKICMMGYHKNMEVICENFVWKQKLKNNNELSWRVNKVRKLDNTYILRRER